MRGYAPVQADRHFVIRLTDPLAGERLASPRSHHFAAWVNGMHDETSCALADDVPATARLHGLRSELAATVTALTAADEERQPGAPICTVLASADNDRSPGAGAA